LFAIWCNSNLQIIVMHTQGTKLAA
jgi:hypothetical protein